PAVRSAGRVGADCTTGRMGPLSRVCNGVGDDVYRTASVRPYRAGLPAGRGAACLAGRRVAPKRKAPATALRGSQPGEEGDAMRGWGRPRTRLPGFAVHFSRRWVGWHPTCVQPDPANSPTVHFGAL